MLTENHKTRINYVQSYIEKIKLEAEVVDYYLNKSILIVGGAGAIGSNLVIALSLLVGEEGKIIVLDNLFSIKIPEAWNVMPLENVMFIKGDVRNEVDLKRAFKEEPQIIFNLAAFFANQNSIDYPEIAADVDIIGTIKLLEYARLAKVDRFIYASSGGSIYGSYPKLPIKEDFISMNLTTPYQINKMTGEMYCNFYMHHYGLNIVNCRFFSSYGPGEVPGQYRNVIPNFLYWAIKGESIPITGTGEETRDFTFVLDLVQGLIKVGYYPSAVGESFNLAAGHEIRICDLAEIVNKTTKNKAPVIFRPRRIWDTKPHVLASIKKAQQLIFYKPVVNFEEGFSVTLQWFYDNWNLIEKYVDFKPGMNSAVRKK